MRRTVVFSFTLLSLMFCCVGSSFAEKAKVILKMGSDAPDEVGWSVYLKSDVAPALIRETNGEAAFVWYWGGVLGGEVESLQKMSIDQLQGSAMSGNKACPEMCVLSLPFLFRNWQEVQYIEGKMRSEFGDLYKKYGNKLLIIAPGGFNPVYSIKKKMRTLDDFAQSRFVAWSTLAEVAILEALGASPIPIALAEASPSLRSGVADSMMIPTPWWVGSQLYTITKGITPSHMQYIQACVILTNEAWNRIPQKYHASIDKTMLALEPGFYDFFSDAAEKCLQAMFKYGIPEVKLTPEELETWKQATRPVWDKLTGKLFTKELLSKIVLHLEEYRSRTSENR